MKAHPQTVSSVAIACGGTGGHLFPGLAVAEELYQRGCSVSLLVSPKEIDQRAIRGVTRMRVSTLPAVGLQRGAALSFLFGFLRSYLAAQKLFRGGPPQCLLAMGGFTSAPPLLAARRFGARAYLHESNTIPGRANRWLSRLVDRAFVAFPSAGSRLRCRNVVLSGTPVRACFRPQAAAACRTALGLEPAAPVFLVMGGSQGATGLNAAVTGAMALLRSSLPDWQWLHLAGPEDAKKLRAAYQAFGLKAAVHPFFDRMELAFGAATIAITRAGASTLAELAAMRVPAVLVPFPHATDNHQWHNARAFEQVGAARLLEQGAATPNTVVRLLLQLASNTAAREAMRRALGQWHKPDSAERIAAALLEPGLHLSQPAVQPGAPSLDPDLGHHPTIVA